MSNTENNTGLVAEEIIETEEHEHHEEHECCCHDHEDHENHDGHHHHHDCGHHHADDIFSATVLRDIRIPSDTPETLIAKLQSGDFGRILRGKGYIRNVHGDLLYVDVTPADSSYRKATPEKAGDKADIFIVIGCSLDENALQNMI